LEATPSATLSGIGNVGVCAEDGPWSSVSLIIAVTACVGEKTSTSEATFIAFVWDLTDFDHAELVVVARQ
jgi:hypothetical protein